MVPNWILILFSFASLIIFAWLFIVGAKKFGKWHPLKSVLFAAFTCSFAIATAVCIVIVELRKEKEPTVQDIREGRAEWKITTNEDPTNDTMSTCKIVWKKNKNIKRRQYYAN